MPSKYWTILSSVQQQLQAVGGAPQNVALRRKLVGLKVDTTPFWVVAPGRGGEKIVEHTFCGQGSPGKPTVVYDYPVVVALIYGGNEVMSTGLQNLLDTRAAVRNAIYQIIGGAIPAGAFDLNMDPDEVSELGAFLGTNYDVNGFGFQYRTDEVMLS